MLFWYVLLVIQQTRFIHVFLTLTLIHTLTLIRIKSDFAKLHQDLQAQLTSACDHVSSRLLPSLPRKYPIISRLRPDDIVESRKKALQKYMNTLLLATKHKPNYLVLSFLGMLNTARMNDGDGLERHNHNPATSSSSVVGGGGGEREKGARRPTIHISKLLSEANTGDIILFRWDVNIKLVSH